MMFQYSNFSPLVNLQGTKVVLDAIPSTQDTNSTTCQNLSFVSPPSNSQGRSLNNNIYVCTFCQVFSTQLIEVAEHIASSHYLSIPFGKNAEDFISKLQALNNNVVKRKVGRPKKIPEQRTESEPKQSLTNPIPGPEGLFWCKNCLRSFRKPRQLTQHKCLGSEELDNFSEESNESLVELDGGEFKTHVDIDPIPWSKWKGHGIYKGYLSTKSVDTSNANNIEDEDKKIAPNWRTDPLYIPLFNEEREKMAFEKHLKSIDYSIVDYLFTKEEKRCRSNKTSSCPYIHSIIYRCSLCKKVLKSLSHIRLHCLTHTDLKPFTCPTCNYSSNSKGSLYVHMRKHTGNVFCCSFCDFKSTKRAHLLDHEATHSSIPQFCKLCKNTYKTLRSLIAHVKKYHNYPGGKRYIKSLTCKQNKKSKCDICKKNFKSYEILSNHNKVCHPSDHITETVESNHEEICTEHYSVNTNNSIHIENSNNLEQQIEKVQSNIIPSKDTLAEIVLNDFLQQEQSQSIMYENVFNELGEVMLPSSFLPKVVLEDFLTKAISNLPADSSIVEECEKTLDLNLLDQCLDNSAFSNQQNFSLPSNTTNIANGHSLCTNSEINSTIQNNLQEISQNKCEEPVEVKLFEKCQRAPAYVCCVCSAIYICPTSLKAHLKEHVNSTTNTLIQPDQFEPTKITEASNDLDVCEILQDSSDSYSYDKELEKLYTSSLDMMWYLPSVSVVLQNDPSLLDPTLDDIANFSISEKYTTSMF